MVDSVEVTEAMAQKASEVHNSSCISGGTFETDVVKAKAGDQAAYERLYHTHHQNVFWHCLRITKNPADAEDVTQQVFLQAYLNLAGFRGECRFGTWLFRIATYESLLHLRKRRYTEISLDELHETTASYFIGQGSSGILRRLFVSELMQRLPEHTRTLILLRHVSGWTQKELTQWLGIPLGTTKAQLSRARKALRVSVETGKPH
jgi:RNA polymerase sigma-70 factor, ECF subfamily